ncbi:TetR/AcrR family transcriptional regulator [Nonomuraea sediminis]|uniref:TetR/AcrR family transcriptional regulator n=1 Tax=Nonomuraea sediminis TaxID=2835864 RepID=UPI001BDDA39E|nr:TetR/AcrR family transcriptional regulator [Nonomuraea sediminis]
MDHESASRQSGSTDAQRADDQGPTATRASRRTDARRNHEQVLAAARAAFAEQGTEASLREVARRAGVGIGTLYRHFPTREALLEALLADGFDRLHAQAVELAHTREPGGALATWVRELAVGSSRYDGLPASVMAALHDPGSDLHASCERLRSAAAGLLSAAQQTGEIRADLTPEELLTTVNAMAWAAKQAAQPPDRYLNLLLDGLEVRQAN